MTRRARGTGVASPSIEKEVCVEPMLTRHHLAELASRPGPWLTLAMPLHGGGPLAKADPIRYRNLVRRASELLDASAIESADRGAMLDALRALGQRHDLFNAGAPGLVVFVSPRSVERWFVPAAMEELVELGPRPFLEPLIPIVTDPTHFYVFALNLHHVRLLECSRFVARELPLPDGTPRRLEDAAGWELRQDSLQYHTPYSGPLLSTGHTRKRRMASGNAGNRPVYHGQGAGKDDTNADFEKFVREVDQGLWEAIVHRSSPVVLATSEQLEPVFRAHTRLPNVVEPFLHGSFAGVSNEELHAAALAIVSPSFEARVDRERERALELLGTGTATVGVPDVVRAAASGKVATLFVRRGAYVPGCFDPETDEVEIAEGEDGDPLARADLIDRAATDTFLSGGTVYRLDAARMPVPNEVAAILRY